MPTPTRSKRRFGRHLADIRRSAQILVPQVADLLKTDASTVRRYESGLVLPVWSTVLALRGLYEFSDEQQTELARLWEVARNEPPPARLPNGTTKEYRQLINAEREAHGVRAVEPMVVPGLLQTERYMRAINNGAVRRYQESQIEGWIKTRLSRQQLLEGDDALIVHVVIDEAAIRRQIGGAEVMREQLDRLIALSKMPNLTIQVAPFEAGSYGATNGACTIVDYPDPENTPNAYLEYPAGGAWVENVDDVKRLTTMFDDAVSAAISPTESVDLITRQIRALERR